MIKSNPVTIDKDVSGLNWEVADFQELAKIVAVIAVGQVVHAARILDQLEQTHQHFRFNSWTRLRVNN